MLATRYETTFTLYPYKKVLAQDSAPPMRHPVVIVGGGPVGLGLALDLGQRGTPVLVLDDHDGAGSGSKAICFAKRTLDIAHRLGVATPMMEKGIIWNVGKVFHAESKLFEFNLLPEDGHRHPAFINLQQPYFEKFIFDGILTAQAQGAPIEVRGSNAVTAIEQRVDHVAVLVDTPDGPYELEADWLIACDGARSSVRAGMGLDFDGRVFEDNFLIADVRMTADFPTERWFWFEPPFKHSGQSALLHKQPDDVWRIDFQLGWDIDRERELDPERIRTRVDAMLSSQTGEVPEYELVWTSIYTFQCRRMEKFRHGRVFFAGDAAHQVSPFGARGANSGMQDAENLAWKLDFVCKDQAPKGLLDSYDAERSFGADENILNSTRATDFMTPKSATSKTFRNAVLTLAQKYSFARPLVNSGRLSVPCVYDGFAHFGEDALGGPPVSRPGASCPDAPLADGFLLDQLSNEFTLLVIGGAAPASLDPMIEVLRISKPSDELATRYLGDASHATYLIRPDHHVVARWKVADTKQIMAALNRTLGRQ